VTGLFVWPRLSGRAERDLYIEVAPCPVLELRERRDIGHPDAAPVAVGGVKVPDATINETQTRLRALADDLEFPKPLTRARVAAFDQPATRLVHEAMRIVPADAANSGVWSFLSLVVAPDVALWRWPYAPPEDDDRVFRTSHFRRISGHPRNVFRRLWWRGEVVGVDLIDAESGRGLGEDELVNIMERVALASDRRLARALGSAVVCLPIDLAVARSEVMRDASKRLLRTMPVIAFGTLSNDEVAEIVSASVAEAIDKVRRSQPPATSTTAGAPLPVIPPPPPPPPLAPAAASGMSELPPPPSPPPTAR
jgi:hypothetical protein